MRIYRNEDSNQVIFEGVEVKAIPCNVFTAEIVDTEFIRIADKTSPDNLRIVNKVLFSEILDEDGNPAGADVNEVLSYVTRQLNTNLSTSVYNAGRLEGLYLSLENDGDNIKVSAGKALVLVGDTLKEVILETDFTYSINDITPNGQDKVFSVAMSGENTIAVTEIAGALNGAAIPSDIRTESFLGIAFYNDFRNKFTFVQTLSPTAKNVGSTVYDLVKALNPKVLPSDRPIITKSTASDMRLGVGSGRVFAFGSNLITGTDTDPNIFEHPANTDVQYLQIAEPNGAGLWQINQLGQMVTFAGDNIWTKYDDGSGALQDTPDNHWVLMPVALNCGQIQQGPVLALPTVYASQKAIPDNVFRLNLEVEAVNALQTFNFPNLTLETSAIIGVIAMRKDAANLADTDKVKIFSGDAEYLTGEGLTRVFQALENVPIYDVYVSEGANPATATGAISNPFDNLSAAVAAVASGGSIFVDGTITVAPLTLPDKSIEFYGSSDAQILGGGITANNSQAYKFENITFVGASGFALDLQAGSVEVRDCDFYHNGWNATEDKTAYLANTSQTEADLLTYYTDVSKVTDGGAIRIQNTNIVELAANKYFFNNQPLIIEDCQGTVFYSREQIANNLRGVKITNCKNVTGYNIAYKGNADNGLTVTGGFNNRFALSVFEQNWGSDLILDSVANTKLRDNDLTNSNRSPFLSTGLAVNGAIHIKGDTADNDRQFLVEVLDTQIHSTDTVTAINQSGIYFDSTIGNLTPGQNLINLDDIGFIGFSNHINMGDCDATNLNITIGDNRSQNNEVSYIVPPSAGNFYSLPYSNHVTKVQFIDFSLDGSATTVVVKDKQTNLVINSYPVNTIHVDATTMNLMFDGKIQIESMDRANISANGIDLNLSTDVATANTLNSMFERTELGGGDVEPPAPTLTGEVEELVSATNYNATYMTLGLPDGEGNQTLISSQTGDNRGDVWSQIPMDQLGEFTQFQTDSAGGGKRFYVGFSRADQLASLGDGSGSGHEGLQWSLAIYDGYDAPWTFYGDQATYSYSSFFTDKEAFRLHSGIRTNKVTWKVGIDQNDGRFYVYFWSIIDLEWKYVAKTSYSLVNGDYHAVVRFYTQGGGFYGDFTNYRFPETDPVLTWYYIESPDGSFYYPLFQTEEEANFVDTAEGGAGESHTHVFVDDQTGTTWYMPDSLQYHDEASAPPANLGTYTGITWNEQATDTDSNYVPSAFTDQTITVNEGDAVNLQIHPADAPYATTIGGIPAWTYNNGFLQGTAPEVTGDNVTNPSDTTTVTVYRTNAYGTSQGTLTIVINNLDAPVTPIAGFTLEGGTALVDSDTMGDGSVVSIDDQVDNGNRFVIEKQWLDNYVLPVITSGSGTKAVWIGFANASANWSTISGADFDLAYQFICDDTSRANNNFVMKVYNQGTTPHSVGIGSLTSGLYDFVFINDDINIKLGSLIESQGHNAFNKVYDTSNSDWKFTSAVTGLTAGAKSVYIATDGTTLDLSAAHFGEGAEPTAPTSLTSWTKALDFSGSNQHAKQVSSNTNYMPIGMDGLSVTAALNATSGYTSNSIYSRPWATVVVFKYDGNNSNQHIWNQGEGAGSTDDNIYLRVDPTGTFYFGWGRQGALNECRLGTWGLVDNIPHWHAFYIASNGYRATGAAATASNLALGFDIRFMGSNDAPSAFSTISSNLSTAANWSAGSTGGGMDRSVTGNFTVGGRGSNRSFHGKIASMVVTTLRVNQPMPDTTEIEMMIKDPVKWLQDYKDGNTYRVASSQAEATFGLFNYLSNSAFATQVWLMGDGTLDNYSNMIRNIVYPQDQNYTKLNLISMVSNDIETVNINGLS